jgi:hypothetical protein
LCIAAKQPLSECTNALQHHQQAVLLGALKAHSAAVTASRAAAAAPTAQQQQQQQQHELLSEEAPLIPTAILHVRSVQAQGQQHAAQSDPVAVAAAAAPVMADIPPSALLGVTRRMAYVRVPKSLLNGGGSSSSSSAKQVSTR